MLRGSSPIRLSQLDISPAIQAGALEQQAAVNLASSVNEAVQDFQAKQQEKEQKKMTANALRQFIPGLGEEVYSAIAKDPQILKSMSDLTNIQAAQQEQEILGKEMAKREEQESILEKAIAANIGAGPEGTLDVAGVRQSFLDLGGTDENVLGKLFDKPGEIKVDKETGIITQDGVFKGQIASALLDIEPSEYDLTLQNLEIQKREKEIERLNAQIEKIKAGNIDPFESNQNSGVTIVGIDGKPL